MIFFKSTQCLIMTASSRQQQQHQQQQQKQQQTEPVKEMEMSLRNKEGQREISSDKFITFNHLRGNVMREKDIFLKP